MQQMFTIGYEGADLDSVMSEMAASRIEVLVDVRAVAVSRRKGFSKGALSDAVKAAGMQYVHVRELGDPKPGREAARAGDLASFRKIYGDHLQTPACTVALAELDALSRRKVVCLLCYEHDATGCHRKIISDKLAVARPLRVAHLRPRHVPSFLRERCTILIKAAPHAGPKHGETVCCAGITPTGEWRRLYPVPFRRLPVEKRFGRWDWVDYEAIRPLDDRRPESRRLREDSLQVSSPLAERRRASFLEPVLEPSWQAAHARGRSLALIRPVPGSFRFFWKRKTQARLERDQRGAEKTVAQLSMLDEPLRPLEACPYEFRATFADAQGEWDRQCGDWEVEATFFRFRRQLGSDDAALAAMSKIFNVDYVDGLAIAMGNQARSPGTWMLLGIIRLRETNQPALL